MNTKHCNMACDKANVGTTERAISAAAGAFFLYKSFTGKRNWLNGALGAALLGRGATGYCGVYDALNIDTNCKKDSETK